QSARPRLGTSRADHLRLLPGGECPADGASPSADRCRFPLWRPRGGLSRRRIVARRIAADERARLALARLPGGRSRRRCRSSASYSMPRLGPPTYAIIANCELVTVVVVGAAVLGEKLTPSSALGGGLILAGILLHGWVRKSPRNGIGEKPRAAAG